ncbi:MAG: hypothetical protein JWM34_4037 [Ilumatobacteraceae bacterium]|nr:hypothetical protein [Ilumatobacteraceae bacterium]
MQRARGLAAVIVLVGLVAAVPFALIRFVGRVWPAPFPPLDVIWRSVKSGDFSDTTVIKFLAVIVWLAWVRLTVSIVIDIAARCSGHHVPRISGLGSAQRWAAALVASALLLVASSSRLALASAASAMPRPIPIMLLSGSPMTWTHLVADETSTVSAAGPVEQGDAAATPAADAGGHVHVVERHESFWSIAADSLGDGARWREIVELNAGREVAPGIVFDGTPDRLQPGWELMVPGGEVAVVASTSSAAPIGRDVVVERGDTLSGIAARELGDAADWPAIWDVNHGRAFGERTFDDPDLILPGWDLVLPSTDGAAPGTTPVDADAEIAAPTTSVAPPAPVASEPSTTGQPAITEEPATTTTAVPVVTTTPATSTATTAATTTSSTPTTTVAPPSSIAPTVPAFERHDSAPIGTIGGAVLVASGVMGAVAMRRRRRLRSSAVHARLAESSPAVVAVDRTLRSLDDGERIARLDIALRAAGHDLLGVGSGATVLAVIASPDGQLDLLLSAVADVPPAPWVSVSDHCWRLPTRVALVDLAGSARRAQQPCPALAHLGTTPRDGGGVSDLFVDLEAVGMLSIDAAPGVADSIVRAIAAGVAVSPLAEVAHIITTGFGDPHLGHPSTHEALTLDHAIEMATTSVGATSRLTAGGLSTFALRSRPALGDAWEPAIVFIADQVRAGAPAATASLLQRVGGGGRALAVVSAGAVDGAAWTLRGDGTRWTLDPLQLEVVPIGLSRDDVDQIQQLLDDADAPLLDAEPVSAAEVLDAAHPDAVERLSAAEPSWSLMVRVLGRPAVVDRSQHKAPFERSKALELVVWMSQHRDRSSRSGARTALWESDVRDTTFANVVSDARRSLARLVPPVEGEEWIGRTLTDDLPLHPAVVTDAQVLADTLSTARALPSADAVLALRPALALVRDMPFAGAAYLWPDTEGTTTELILLVTSAATVLAGHSLALGDVEGVFWATGQGLKALPGHEELIALRMRAHGREGDLAGVRTEWANYERVLHSEAFSDGEPAPKLVALRRELLTSSLAPISS